MTQTLHYFVQAGGAGAYLNQEMLFTSIVAALIHDCGHPGVNNSFLVQTSSALAIRYNDQSPLENMHCATAFGLMNNVDRNVLANIPKQSRDTVREAIISMVLATDNTHHFKHVGELKATLEEGMDPANNTKHLRILLNIALHAADVSNPTKPFDTYMKWTHRVLEEFHNQGDAEAKAGLAISRGFDRADAAKPGSLAAGQTGFMRFIVADVYVHFDNIPGIDLKLPLKCMNDNFGHWERENAKFAVAEAEEEEEEEEKKKAIGEGAKA